MKCYLIWRNIKKYETICYCNQSGIKTDGLYKVLDLYNGLEFLLHLKTCKCWPKGITTKDATPNEREHKGERWSFVNIPLCHQIHYNNL